MTTRDAQANVLLAMLPLSVVERLGSPPRFTTAAAGDVLLDPGEPIVDLYFPIDLVASFDQVLDDSDPDASCAPGVALGGNEGLIGIERLLGADVSNNRATVRIAGRAVLVDAAAAYEEFSKGGAFHRLLLRTVDYFLLQSCAISACERIHPVEQRLIRWLLMFDDRAPSGPIALTQETLARLMQVRRVSVSAAARLLQLQGLIAYRRGVISIIDRTGLDEKSCKCYRAIKTRFDELRAPE